MTKVMALPESACPHCAAPFNAVMEDPPCGEGYEICAPNRPPHGGDFTICAFCASVLVFTDTLALRGFEPDDFAKLSAEDCRGIEAARQYVIAHMPHREAAQAKAAHAAWN